MNEKEFIQLIKERRTIHSYIQKEVPQAWIEEAVRLSLWAPNHRLSFPWKYYLLSNETQNQVFSWACENKKVSPTDDVASVRVIKEQFLNPRILVLGMKKDSNPVVQKEDYATLSCSVQILSMHLWQKGLGSKWSTGKVSRDPRLYSLLGISENEVAIEGMLMMGWAKDVLPAVERPLTETCFKII